MYEALAAYERDNLLLVACNNNDYITVLRFLKMGIHPNALINGSKIRIEFPSTDIIQLLIIYGIEIHYYAALAIRDNNIAAKVLILNGARIKRHLSYRWHYEDEIPPFVYRWIDSVELLKSNIKNLLALKRRRITTMITLDRFLMKEFALAIWAERYSIS